MAMSVLFTLDGSQISLSHPFLRSDPFPEYTIRHAPHRTDKHVLQSVELLYLTGLLQNLDKVDTDRRVRVNLRRAKTVTLRCRVGGRSGRKSSRWGRGIKRREREDELV